VINPAAQRCNGAVAQRLAAKIHGESATENELPVL